MAHSPPPLTWLDPGEEFPLLHQAWGSSSPAPGLLAAGGALDVATLVKAYRQCTFPWFSEGQPILWWSPDPRMVLQVANFRLHKSLQKTILRRVLGGEWEIRLDSAFDAVIQACAQARRPGQNGTWIVPDMVAAYIRLHEAGYAHSMETWIDGQLVGGLYFVALGRAVFGESMFSRASDTSKVALAALVASCRHFGVTMIDCQQKTSHLASLGAHEMPRSQFRDHVEICRTDPAPPWKFDAVYWDDLLNPPSPPA